MANHSLPTVSSTYANFVAEIDARIKDLAYMLDPNVTTATNVPTNAIRWNSTSFFWQKYNGTSWAELAAAYSININGSVGATTPSTGAFTTLSSSGTTNLATGATVAGVGIVTLSASQTLTNKTLTSPVIATIVNTGTLTLPTTTDTLVGRATTDTLTNKTLTSPRFADLGFIADSSGNELLLFDSVTSAVNYVRLVNAATATNPQLVADGSDANINLDLSGKGTGVVRSAGAEVVNISAAQTLTNKTLTSPVIATIVNTGTLTLPTATDTLVGRATTDTLTNKTLTSPRFADLGFIADSSGNELLSFDSTGSAANYIQIANSATTVAPLISAQGSDANINLNLAGKGTGLVTIGGVEVPTISSTNTLTNKTWNGTAIAVAYGGTGASDAATARANLSVPSTTGSGASGTWSISISGDAATLGGLSKTSASTGSTVVARDGSGDINARLFRSEYDTTNPTIGYIMTQIDTVTNNYIRPSTPAQIATALSGQTMNIAGSSTSCSGNAATATILQTARTINTVSFNGSSNITVEPYVEVDATAASRYLTFVDSSAAGHQRLNLDANLSYNPSTNVLTAGTFSGTLSGNGASVTSINGSNISTGTVATARLGSGTPSSSNFLRGDGSWQSVTSGGSQVFAASGTFTVPAGVTKVKVTVIGGGGGGGGGTSGGYTNPGGGTGGRGGFAVGLVDTTPGANVTVTVGAGGTGTNATASGTAGGQSSFGTTVVANGGAGGAASQTGVVAATGTTSGTDLLMSYPELLSTPRTSGTTGAVAYSEGGSFNPGLGGRGETSSSANNSTGGVGGMVLVEW